MAMRSSVVTMRREEADQTLPVHLCKQPAYQAFLRKFRGSTDPTKYAFRDDATLVPLTDSKGQVPGDGNPYGRVVPGHIVGPGDKVIGEVSLELLERAVRGKKPPVDDTSSEFQESLAAMSPEAAAAERQAQELEKVLQESAAPVVAAPAAPPPPRPAPSIRVELKGGFGKAILPCIEVVCQDNLVVLLQGLGDATFEPPPSEAPLTLRYHDNELAVFAIGVAFDLRSRNLHAQVFVLQT